MEKHDIIVRVDTNDGDYDCCISTITKKEIDKLIPLFEAIKNFKPYKVKYKSSLGSRKSSIWDHSSNYPTGECLRDDLGEKPPRELYDFDEEIFELFEEYLPWPQHGFHTIENIWVIPNQKKDIFV